VQRRIIQLPQLVAGVQLSMEAATPAKKNSGMTWNTQVNAWKTGDAASRLFQMNTPSRSVLVAMMVCPTTTPTNDTMRMTSMARSRVAGVLASQGFYVLLPNPRGSYGQGEEFTRGNVKDFGYGDLRDILGGIDAATAAAPIDPERTGIYGWSYGGYMTMWSLTQTNRFKAAVSGAGLSDWLSYYGTNEIDTWMIPYFGASVYDDPSVYAKSSPINYIKGVKTPTLMVAGDRDAEVPVTQSYEYHHALRALNVPTQLVIYPGEGHLFYKPADQQDVARRIVTWFDHKLP